ncbi:hypothetical protein [Microbacterium sp. Kw_RZR3]|jgi:hypothetical protein|uniref:hypothetical protein n=1 Tax=unclassified Microbacterium TaxID=2609290 RepID=UPI0023DC5700|nr:hypothetical protein [Microbacterium sp. Kw_RZR3]MDF2045968.1 hypothetical protein [Microbacterium sp. Kw_RZR3]MDF2917530.1 hypothetical protein [Microbacterium sp.]
MRRTATIPSRRLGKIATIAVIPLSFIAAGALVSTASYSAFSATTSNPSNNWSAGSVGLTNSSPNSAAFDATNLKPGSTGTTCVAVTSTGTLPAAVKLYATNASQSQGIGDWLNLTVTQGTGGGNGSCNGFSPISSGASVYDNTLSSFVNGATDYGSGVGNWAPAGGSSPETRTFQITYAVSTNAPSSIMGATANVNFTWEAQNQ